MVFLDGVPIRLLETEARAFRFVRAECSVRVVPLRHRVDPASSNGSSADEEDRPDFPLSRNAYTLARFDGWHCIHLRSITGEHQELVLPCCEAFRILYAPQRPIALALTNGPWEETFRMVVDDAPDRPTKAHPDGSWHVSLAGGVTKEHAAVLANLVLGRPAGVPGIRSGRPSRVRPCSSTARPFPADDRRRSNRAGCVHQSRSTGTS